MSRILIAGAALLLLSACDWWSHPSEETPAAAESGPIDVAALEGRLVAHGADPAWRLDADPQLGVILSLDDLGMVYSADYAAPTPTATGGARLQSGDVALTLEPQPCRIDGKVFAMTATVEADSNSRTGCAAVRWDQHLAELLPAIDACIARVPQKLPIQYAAKEADGRVLVRLGRAVDCRAPLDPSAGGEVVTRRYDESLAIGGDGDARFFRAPGDNPGGECYEAPEVRAADGTLLGWLDDAGGC